MDTMTADEFVRLVTLQELDARSRGSLVFWGWIDRRAIDGTVRVLTGPYAGQTFGPKC